MTFGLYTWKFHDRTQICICAPLVFMCLLLHKTRRNMILASRGARRRLLCRVGTPFQGAHFWYVEKMGGARTWGDPWCLLPDQKLWSLLPQTTRSHPARTCAQPGSVVSSQLMGRPAADSRQQVFPCSASMRSWEAGHCSCRATLWVPAIC